MKRNIYILIVLVAIVASAWLVFGHKGGTPATNNTTTNGSDSHPQSGSDNSYVPVDTATADSETGNAISGELRLSDNSAKGNLMIVSGNQVVYLSTSRDFSALLGKNVKASIDGDLNGFTLKDIVVSP